MPFPAFEILLLHLELFLLPSSLPLAFPSCSCSSVKIALPRKLPLLPFLPYSLQDGLHPASCFPGSLENIGELAVARLCMYPLLLGLSVSQEKLGGLERSPRSSVHPAPRTVPGAQWCSVRLCGGRCQAPDRSSSSHLISSVTHWAPTRPAAQILMV